MQLCQKNSLREWLCDNLERDHLAILHMFNQIVQAVEYVHLQGLIHRDLKVSRSNVFYSSYFKTTISSTDLWNRFCISKAR